MATTNERVAVLETKVDELKETVKINDVELKTELKKMYDASCSQHAKLSDDIDDLKSYRNWLLGACAVLSPVLILIANHFINALK
jgi:hypothetical protein